MFYDEYIYWCGQKGESPAKVAKLNGISESAPSQWKKRGFTPRYDAQKKLAAYFGVSIERLNDHTKNEEKAPGAETPRAEKLKEFIEIFYALPEEKRRAVLEYLRFLASK